MKLVDIIRTWYPFKRSKEDTQQLVLQRASVCDTCPSKKQLGAHGGFVTGPNQATSVYYCGSCGCPLWSKLKEPDNACPENKWTAEIEESYY